MWPSNPRPAKSLTHLLAQINEMAPDRSKASDGMIGDASHQSSDSDHNPWVKDGATGIVTALDVTHDPAHGVDAQKIVNALVASRDSRIKYLIHNGRMWRSYTKPGKPGIPAWSSAPYTGSNPHAHHFHLSVQPDKALYDSEKDWKVAIPPSAPLVQFRFVLLDKHDKQYAISPAVGPKGLDAQAKKFVENHEKTIWQLAADGKGPHIKRKRLT